MVSCERYIIVYNTKHEAVYSGDYNKSPLPDEQLDFIDEEYDGITGISLITAYLKEEGEVEHEENKESSSSN